jgi:hypothetical protein
VRTSNIPIHIRGNHTETITGFELACTFAARSLLVRQAADNFCPGGKKK